jgi:hypothetical protein
MTPSLRPASSFGKGMSIAILLSAPVWLAIAWAIAELWLS